MSTPTYFVSVPSVSSRTGTPYWEFVTIPGGLVGHGTSQAAARLMLLELILWTVDEEPDFRQWYREAWNYAAPGEAKLFAAEVRRIRAMEPGRVWAPFVLIETEVQ